jgi:hypothetical protein
MSLYKVYNGTEFNILFPETKFYIFINKNRGNTELVTGLNVDTKEFMPIPKPNSGGIYFCEYNAIHLEFDQSHNTYREVTIPDDAQVYIELNKFKADKLILSEEKNIWNNEHLCKKILIERHCFFGDFAKIINQTEELCIIAVSKNPFVLWYVKNQTEDICKIAVYRNYEMLEYVENQTEEICKSAVQVNGLTLRHVKNQTDEICKLAVQNDGNALYYVKNQTPEICKIAVENNSDALYYVKNPTNELYEKVPCTTKIVCKVLNKLSIY